MPRLWARPRATSLFGRPLPQNEGDASRRGVPSPARRRGGDPARRIGRPARPRQRARARHPAGTALSVGPVHQLSAHYPVAPQPHPAALGSPDRLRHLSGKHRRGLSRQGPHRRRALRRGGDQHHQGSRADHPSGVRVGDGARQDARHDERQGERGAGPQGVAGDVQAGRGGVPRHYGRAPLRGRPRAGAGARARALSSHRHKQPVRRHPLRLGRGARRWPRPRGEREPPPRPRGTVRAGARLRSAARGARHRQPDSGGAHGRVDVRAAGSCRRRSGPGARRQGNAGGGGADAAVTAAAVLNVVEPQMTGIGGDMFAMVWSAKDRRLYGLNGSGRAGSLMTRDALLAKGHATMPQESVEDVTVPGALSGWDALLRRFGTVTLAQALAPAIGYAEGGFPVTPIITAEWGAEVAKLRKDEGARASYLVEGSRAPRPGEWFRNPDLARTLRLIAEQGIGELYGGELGRRIAERVRALGGYLTVDDFKSHRPRSEEHTSETPVTDQ